MLVYPTPQRHWEQVDKWQVKAMEGNAMAWVLLLDPGCFSRGLGWQQGGETSEAEGSALSEFC